MIEGDDYERNCEAILNPGPVVGKLYRKKSLMEIAVNGNLFPPNILFEDNAVIQDMMFHFDKFEQVGVPLYNYFQNSQSTVHKKATLQTINDRLFSARMLINLSKTKGYYSEFKDVINLRFAELFYFNTIYLIAFLDMGIMQRARLLACCRNERKYYCRDLKVDDYFRAKNFFAWEKSIFSLEAA